MSETIIDVLKQHVAEKPDSCAYAFLTYAGDARRRIDLTYHDLFVSVKKLASYIREFSSPGDRVLLSFSLNDMQCFIVSFYACLYAGVIAVPVYPPRKSRPLERFKAIQQSCQSGVLLTTHKLCVKAKAYVEETLARQFVWLDVALAEQKPEMREAYCARDDTTAFLQYTSGSTGDPKGVMVSHRNIISNQAMIKRAFSHDAESRFVGWLPLFHDMGLIGNVLQPMYIGAASIMMSPGSFFQSPLRWLNAISDYKAHTSGAPNFAYGLCVDALTGLTEKPDMDLSCWKIAFNGAEPIRYETIEQFQHCFAYTGLAETAMYPCYGLAEATLFVTGGQKLALPKSFPVNTALFSQGKINCDEQSHTRVVSSGNTVRFDNVRIVSTKTGQCVQDGTIGEIFISGDNVASGYWGRGGVANESFSLVLGEDGKSYFKTGDLGFIREGELYVTGRLKDLLIIRGRNYYPQDIERVAVDAHDAILPMVAAAFSVSSAGLERVVLVLELRRAARDFPLAEVKNSVHAAITSTLSLSVFDVVFLKPHGIPVTSSGKVRRHLVKKLYEAGELKSLESNSEDKAVCATDSVICDLITAQLKSLGLRFSTFELEKPLEAYGLDSFQLIQLVGTLSKALDVSLEVSDIIDLDSISELLLFVQRRINEEESASVKKQVQELKEVPLSRLQQSVYYMQKAYPQSRHYVIDRKFELRSVAASAVKAAFLTMLASHPLLKSTIRFYDHRDVKLQVTDSIRGVLEIQGSYDPEVFSQRCLDIKNEISCEEGAPLVRILLSNDFAGNCQVYFAVHHIIVDAWSLNLVLMTFLSALQGSLVEGMRFETALTYYQHETALLANQALTKFWSEYYQTTVLDKGSCLDGLNFPVLDSAAYYGAQPAMLIDFSLSKEEYLEVDSFITEHKLTLYTLFVSVYAFTLYKYSGASCRIIGSPFSNRQHSRHADTVGLFVNTLPLVFTVEEAESVREFMLRQKEMIADCARHQSLPLSNILNIADSLGVPAREYASETLFTFQRVQGENQALMNALMLNRAGEFLERNAQVPEGEQVIVTHETMQSSEAILDCAITVGDSITGYVKSPVGVLPEYFVRQFVGDMKNILWSFVRKPHALLNTIPAISEQRFSMLSDRYNADNVSVPDKTLYDLFQASVDAYKGQVAVQDSEQSLTYGELSQSVNALARLLEKEKESA